METAADISSSRPPVRVGIVGAGRSVLLTHLAAFRALPKHYAVTAVCDLEKERRDQVAQFYPAVRPYRRIEDMLDDPEMDLVFIALPSRDHVACALSSLARGKWTVLESPIALSHEEATVLKAAAMKARGKLLPCLPGMFAPEFLLTRQVLSDARLGNVYEAVVRRQDYVRRDDWQSVMRCGGGAAWYEGPETVQQAVTLLGGVPVQLWGELKRVVSLGDAEDTLHMVLKGRGNMSVYIDVGGGRLDAQLPAFEVRGDRGVFSVMPGAREGKIRAIDPDFKFARRRCSVRTPPVADLHEEIPVKTYAVSWEGTDSAAVGFWRALHDSVCRAAPFVVPLEDAVETIRYLQVVKQASPFAK